MRVGGSLSYFYMEYRDDLLLMMEIIFSYDILSPEISP